MFSARRERARIVESFGTLDWDEDYDYQADRRSREVASATIGRS